MTHVSRKAKEVHLEEPCFYYGVVMNTVNNENFTTDNKYGSSVGGRCYTKYFIFL
jgi:hypothetical protein